MKTNISKKHYIFIIISAAIISTFYSSSMFTWLTNKYSELSSNQSQRIMKKDSVAFGIDQSKKQLNVTFFHETKLGRAILAYLLCEDFDCTKTLQDLIRFGPEAVSPLIQLLLYGVPPETTAQVPGNVLLVVRSRAISALGDLGNTRALSPLIASLQDFDPLIRAKTAEALGKLDGEAALMALLPLLRDPDPLVRETVASALGRLKRPEVLSDLRSAAGAELEPHVRHAMDAAIEAIGQR